MLSLQRTPTGSIGVLLITQITHVRSIRKKNIYDKVALT